MRHYAIKIFERTGNLLSWQSEINDWLAANAGRIVVVSTVYWVNTLTILYYWEE